MNVFNRVTLRSLKMNKTRTVVTVIGIMLSAAMICAVTTFVSSIRNYVMEYAVYSEGDWHGAVSGVSWQEYEELAGNERVVSSAYGQLLGYAKIDSKNEYKPYVYVIGGERDSFFETMPVHLIAGHLPEEPSQIIVPEHLSSNGGVSLSLGDTLTLELGTRTLDGFPLGQNNPCYTYDNMTHEEFINDEVIEVREKRTYTVVGIYERPNFERIEAPGYTLLTVADRSAGVSAVYDVYFKLDKAADIYDFMEANGLEGTQNSTVLQMSGVFIYDSFYKVLLNLSIIVIVLIIFGSVALIYNAFSISVSERTRQFGLLSSVGATKKQLKRSVFFEAFAVSCVGIPLGIILGIGGIGITLIIIGNKFSSMMGNYDVPMRISVSWISVVTAVLVALVTILISAWIPSRRATKISAVEAIRQNSDVKTKNRPVKTSKITYALFGLPGVLATKYYKRSRKKYRATVISLFMSIVLFVSASSFTGYLTETVSGGYATNGYDLRFSLDEGQDTGVTPDEVLKLLTSDENVTSGVYAIKHEFQGNISTQDVTEDYLMIYGRAGASSTALYGYIYFVNDSEFERLINAYKLDRGEYFDPAAPTCVFLNRNTVFSTAEQRFVTVDVLKNETVSIACSELKSLEGYILDGAFDDGDGNKVMRYVARDDDTDVIEIPYDEAFDEYTLHTGKIVTETPFYVDSTLPASLNLIYPISMFEYVLPEEVRDDEIQFEFFLTSGDHAASFENLRRVLSTNGLVSEDLIDYAERVEVSRNFVSIVRVFSYGFIVLISLIAAANVFNTISTNIGLRRREFAMLKSVGMTRRGFDRMMNFECLLYGSKALLFGLPVSAVVAFLIYLSVSGGYETSYQLPWQAIGTAVLSVFLVVFSAMIYSMSKVRKDNPIDALKNENL